LLHVHYAIPHSIARHAGEANACGRDGGLPFITTLHGTDITLVGADPSYFAITKILDRAIRRRLRQSAKICATIP